MAYWDTEIGRLSVANLADDGAVDEDFVGSGPVSPRSRVASHAQSQLL